MTPILQNTVKEVCRESCKHRILRFGPIVLSLWFMIFLNLQSFGKGLDFCFDASKEGHRLNTTKTIKYVHAESGVDCIMQCMLQEKSCRSANFRKTCGGEESCELLKTVDSEEPAGNLKKNDTFDYYILLQPERKAEDAVSSRTPSQISTTKSTTEKKDDSTTQPTTPGLPGSCESADWSASFDSIGWSKCLITFPYINGLNRSLATRGTDWLRHLEGASCCEGFENISSECVEVDWRERFIRRHWNMCTPGYYLSGLYRSHGHFLSNIEEAWCCKPNGAPKSTTYYDEDVSRRFDWYKHGMVSCTKAGYYITGLYRHTCNLLHCIEKFKCCKL